MTPWVERPTIDLELERPGPARFERLPAEARELGRDLLQGVLAEFPPAARHLAQAVRWRTGGRFQQEARDAAAWLDVDWRDLVLASVSYDLALSAFGCSTVALATPDGPAVARNLDWWPEALLARGSFRIRTTRGGELAYATAGWPGALGVVTGVSARGFALVLNAVSSPEGIDRRGYPVLLHLRRVLENAATFDEALALLRDTRLVAPCLITLVGAENHQRVVVERSPQRHALRWAEGDAPLIATNDYRLLFPPETRAGNVLYETTCGRFEALTVLLDDVRPTERVEDDVLLGLLADEAVIQGITVQHVLMRPARAHMRVFVPARLLGTP